MKRVLWILSLVVLIVSVIVLVASFPVASSYHSKAQLVQRVEIDKGAADLFGDASAAYRPIGSPQMLIIDDEKAFVDGAGDDNARMVDEGYLTEHKIYPLQLRTVDFVTRWTRIGCGLSFVCALLGLVCFRRKNRH